ncbi:MAG: hypothetical protein EB127_20860, partial [Alphaproteobacteria bacterium]|nr:hypothetical protein [Alphaproteobacteria bacterium]
KVKSSTKGGAITYMPIEILWKTDTYFSLISPELRMTGPPDDRFVDSTGSQKSVGKTNRIRITLSDIFELDRSKTIPDIHIFLYTDLIDRIVGPRPLGERDVFGRIIPYFPYLDPTNLPDSTGQSVITPVIVTQAEQTAAALKQCTYLGNLLIELKGALQLPKLDGVKFIRWAWNIAPSTWEGPAILFFGARVTHERPFMRFFPGVGQPLTKIHVKKGFLPIPDIADPSLLMTWKQDKNPDIGKDCMYMKLSLSNTQDTSLYATMRIWNDGTSDLLIQPPKHKRNLEPYSDLETAPEALEAALVDLPYGLQSPSLAQIDAVLKIRINRDDSPITKTVLQKRLKAFSSIFQEIPPLPEENPIAMLRFKGISNFSSEDRIFAFLTQIATHEIIAGETREDTWAPRVSEEFQLTLSEARKQVVSWLAQRNEYVLAVPETKDYILNKNPGVDIAIYAQHPMYYFHIYRVESFQVYKTITNLLGILFTAPADKFTSGKTVVVPMIEKQVVPPNPVLPSISPAVDGTVLEEESDVDSEGDDLPSFIPRVTTVTAPTGIPVTAGIPVKTQATFLPSAAPPPLPPLPSAAPPPLPPLPSVAPLASVPLPIASTLPVAPITTTRKKIKVKNPHTSHTVINTTRKNKSNSIVAPIIPVIPKTPVNESKEAVFPNEEAEEEKVKEEAVFPNEEAEEEKKVKEEAVFPNEEAEEE